MKRILKVLFLAAAFVGLMMIAVSAEGEPCRHEVYHCEPNNASAHWLVCDTCGDIIGLAAHTAACNAPDTCAACGATGLTDVTVAHVNETHYESNSRSHWSVCDGCGETIGYTSTHAVNCDAPDTCTICGATGVTSSWVSHLGETHYESNGDFHWEVCDECGEMVGYRDSHRVYCDDQDTCSVCGATDMFDPWVRHIGDTHYEYNAKYHWEVCEECGEPIDKYLDHRNLHETNCNNPDFCAVCGSTTVVYADVSHVGTTHYESNGQYHWEVCDKCGRMDGHASRHEVYCDAPDFCYVCGATGVTVPSSYTGYYHHVGELHYESNDSNSHSAVYDCCGAVRWSSQSHTVYCDVPDTCIDCGATGVTSNNVHHRQSTHYESDDELHWIVCDDCADPTRWAQEHYRWACDDPDECYVCGAPCTGGGYYHRDFHAESINDLQHQWVCDVCGKPVFSYFDLHSVYCDEPNVCIDCGVTCTTVVIHHPSLVECSNESYRWEACGECGEVITYSGGNVLSPHYAACTHPNVCYDCGEPYTGSLSIHENIHLTYDGEHHWYVCDDCGEICNDYGEGSSLALIWDDNPPAREAHYTDCTKPGVCLLCGAPYAGSHVEHNGNTTFWYDENGHGSICDSCGKLTYYEEHEVWCQDVGVLDECYYCGMPYAGPNLNHPADGYSHEWVQYDNDTHWYICDSCGLPYDEAPHVLVPELPGICVVCGATNLSAEDDIVTISPATLSGEFTVGAPITAVMNAENALAYNYWLFNDKGVIVQEHANTTDASWTFTVDEPGIYLLRTYATNFVTEAWTDTEWFAVQAASVPAVSVSDVTVSGDLRLGAALTGQATVENAYAYNYWLFNDQGVIVKEHTNTTDTSWAFTIDEPGTYLLRVYATDFITEDWNDSAWFTIAEPDRAPVTVSDVTVSGDLRLGAALTGQATVENAYAYNYWLFNDQGVIVKEHTNTTDTSWAFTVDEPGEYLLRVYATDFLTEDWNDSAWFTIAEPDRAPVTVSDVTVSGDLRLGAALTGRATVENAYAYNYWLFNDQGVIVQAHTNTTDTSWAFTIDEPGEYLLRVYATDFITEDWNDSVWFTIEAEPTAEPDPTPSPTVDPTAEPTAEPTPETPDPEPSPSSAPENAVTISSVSLSAVTLNAGDRLMVRPRVRGGSGTYTYHYWVLDADGAIIQEKADTTDSSASFVLSEPGRYLVRVSVTDSATSDSADSAWITVVEAADPLSDAEAS